MAPFLLDTFTAPDSTLLHNHAPDTGGTWEALGFRLPDGTARTSTASIVGNRLVGVLGGQGYRNTIAPSSAEYTVEATMAFGAGTNINSQWTQCIIAARMTPSATVFSDVDYYWAGWWGQSGYRTWTICKVVNGVVTILASYSEGGPPYAITGDTYILRFEVTDAHKTLFVNGVPYVSTSDNEITQAGSVGVCVGDPDGWLDDLSATEIVSHPYHDAALALNPAVHWSFTEPLGNTVADSGSGGIDLTRFGATLGQSGPVAGLSAASLDGVDDYFATGEVTLFNDLAASNAMTWVGWLYLDVTPDEQRWLDNRATGGYAIRPKTNGWQFTKYGVADYDTLGGTGAAPTGAWTHVAVVMDGTTLRLYRDGALLDTETISTSYVASTNPLVLGREFGGSNWWDGLFGPISAYDYVLSEQQISDLYDATFESGGGGEDHSGGSTTTVNVTTVGAGTKYEIEPPTNLQVAPNGTGLLVTWSSSASEHMVERERWSGIGDPV
jgi:hypothetical protein